MISLDLGRTLSNLDENNFSLDVKPAKKQYLKTPKIFKGLTLKVVFDGAKSKTEKGSRAKKPIISAPVPSQETLDKGLVQSATALRSKVAAKYANPDSFPPTPPASPISLQVSTSSSAASSPLSVASTISGSSTITACEKPEDDPNDDDYSDILPSPDEDDKVKISRLTRQNGDLSCRLDVALSEIVQLKMKLNRLSSRPSSLEVTESTTIELTVQTEPSTPKSVKFADPLVEHRPAAVEAIPEAVEALCLAHAQISDLEAEKQAAEEEMATLEIELHIVETRLHEWEKGVTARLKTLEEDLDDQKSEITYLHNKLREARGQSPLSTDPLGRSHLLVEEDITTIPGGKDDDADAEDVFQDCDSDWDASSVNSGETIRCSKMSPNDWPSLLDEQFPTPPPLTGCLEKAKNIIKTARGRKPVPVVDEKAGGPASVEASSEQPKSSSANPSPQPSLSSTNSEAVQEASSEGQIVGLSLQLPLTMEVESFRLPEVSKPSTKMASKLESIPEIVIHPPIPLLDSSTIPLPTAPADGPADASAEITVGRRISITTARASLVPSS
ncbi:hypothetical protein FRC04_003239 [Tulasnella sp. 424]|nr:hypothetical protein FRC04_003239 [Tulasnella sp. 424]KAG8965943.1 hypothetical protein FRC05_002934 [Tulasnella sp. 425]